MIHLKTLDIRFWWDFAYICQKGCGIKLKIITIISEFINTLHTDQSPLNHWMSGSAMRLPTVSKQIRFHWNTVVFSLKMLLYEHGKFAYLCVNYLSIIHLYKSYSFIWICCFIMVAKKSINIYLTMLFPIISGIYLYSCKISILCTVYKQYVC
jgi:hypothetical protein